MLAWLVRAALTQRVLVIAMAALLVVLGLRATGDVPLDVFEKAVNDNAVGTGMSERLGTFIACAKRRGSTHVYWA